jgi:uncharacterized protein YwqG
MPKKKSIEFYPAKEPIEGFVTKFGGQPNWLEKPEWPLSKKLGEPMRFIGQIALESELFGNIPGRMAYLFMTDDPDVDSTWSADGGENALIIQPGTTEIKTAPLTKGPTFYHMEKKLFGAITLPKTDEFRVQVTPGEDPEFIDEASRIQLSDEQDDALTRALDGNKIGGVPGFLQSDEFPEDGPWNLVLQLDSTKVPFYVNFGDAGIGYAFISEDGKRGRFLWQCC